MVDNYKGGRFNRPNDVICHSNGCLYFTDPDKRRPYHEREIPGPAGDNNLWDGACVYRLAPDGSLSVLAHCEYPNGLALSPDERTMYVANTRSSQYIHAIKLDAAGNMVGRGIFADLNEGTEPGIPDGLEGRQHRPGVLHRAGGHLGDGARRQAIGDHQVAGAGGEFRFWRAGSADTALLCAYFRLHVARQGAGQPASLVQVAGAVSGVIARRRGCAAETRATGSALRRRPTVSAIVRLHRLPSCPIALFVPFSASRLSSGSSCRCRAAGGRLPLSRAQCRHKSRRDPSAAGRCARSSNPMIVCGETGREAQPS